MVKLIARTHALPDLTGEDLGLQPTKGPDYAISRSGTPPNCRKAHDAKLTPVGEFLLLTTGFNDPGGDAVRVGQDDGAPAGAQFERKPGPASGGFTMRVMGWGSTRLQGVQEWGDDFAFLLWQLGERTSGSGGVTVGDGSLCPMSRRPLQMGRPT